MAGGGGPAAAGARDAVVRGGALLTPVCDRDLPGAWGRYVVVVAATLAAGPAFSVSTHLPWQRLRFRRRPR